MDDAGIGDPYWYEWFVGLRRALELLDPDSGLSSVVFQASGVDGIDDVVVSAVAGTTQYVQVKHTREANTLSFGDLVTPRNAGASLLRKTAAGWKAQRLAEGQAINVTLATNRALGQRPYRDNPRLDEFWNWLGGEAELKDLAADFDVPAAYQSGFDRFLTELSDLDDDERIEFLRSLEIDTTWPSLGDLETQCIERLAVLLAVSQPQAADLFTALAGSLRHWTTSTRTSEQVRVEDVWSALTSVTETIGDHDLAPPAPFLPSRSLFLDELRDAVLAEDASAVWLVGEPGSGKTSIISACTNAANAFVDIRFHAYLPITPETKLLPADSGRLVRVEALWGDLLSQLRARFFAGRLARHRVPVRNAFLGADQLRDEVLRLAAIVAGDVGRPFVIAIDGLDHAARAGARGRPLLDSLPAPDALPPNVRVLLGGQPYYDEYPDWLMRHARQVAVPAVSGDDVRTLLQDRLPDPEFHGLSDDVEAAARAVAELAEGNCLTAVFAVEELRGLGSAGEAGARLSERSLGTQLDAYYAQLWLAASRPLDERSLGASVDLAATLCLSPERVTGALLEAAFRERGITALEWEAALRSLQPLVIEEQGGWRTLVNDVRVFLDGKRAEADGSFSDAASRLADVLGDRGNPDAAVYTGLPVLLEQAGRGRERVGRFTPDWVLGAYEAWVSLSELQAQADEVLAYAADADWEDLFSYARGLFTLEQLGKSLEWLDLEAEPAVTAKVPPCLPTEGRVPPGPSMQAAELLRMAQDAATLVEAGENSRALALVHRWLAAAPLPRFWRAIERNDRRREDVDQLTSAAESLGEVSVALERPALSKRELDSCEGARRFSLFVAKGGIRRAGRARSSGSWDFVLEQLLVVFQPNDLVEPIEAAVLAGDFGSIRPLLDWHAGRPPGREMAAAAELWLHVARVMNAEPAASLQAYLLTVPGILNSQEGRPDYSRETEVWSLLAFLRGYLRPVEGQGSNVLGEVLAAFDQNYAGRDERRARSRRVLRIATDVGEWFARLQAGRLSRPDMVVLPNQLEAVVGELVAIASMSNYDDPGAPKAASVIFHLLANVAWLDNRDRAPWRAVLAAACEYCAGDSLGPLRGSVLWVLRTANRLDVISDWRDHWCARHVGRLWADVQNDQRSEILGFFAEASRDAGDSDAVVAVLRDLDRRTRLGFAGRKEGLLYVPLVWFEALALLEPPLWRELGLRLLRASETVSRDGENSFDRSVQAAVYESAARAGERAILELVESRRRAAPNEQLPQDELVSFLGAAVGDATRSLKQVDVEALWSAVIGLFVWAFREDRHVIGELRMRLEESAKRSGVEFIAVREEMCNQSAVAHSESGESGESGESDESDDESATTVPASSLLELEVAWPQQSRAAKPWADFVRILRSSTDGGDRSEVPGFLELFKRRDFAFGFQFDGAIDAAVALLPLLDERGLRDVLARALQAQFSRADALLLVLACRSLSDIGSSRRMLDAVLGDMESWVESRGFRRLVEPTQLVGQGETPSSVVVWAVSELISALDSVSSDEHRASMRGLSRALLSAEARAELAGALERRGSSLSELSLLFVLEAVVRRDAESWRDLRAIVEAARQSSSLHVRFQGWIVECAHASLSAATQPEFAGAPAADSVLAVMAATPIAVEPERHGSAVTVNTEQATRSAIERVRRATDVELIGGGERAAREREELAGDNLVLHPPRVSWGGVRRLEPAGVEAVGRVVAQEMAPTGALDGVSPVRIAQALLTGDDPWLATSSPRPIPASMAEGWPGDEWFRDRAGVPQAVQHSELVEALGRLLHADLPSEKLVLGGVARAFGTDFDAVLWMHLAASEELCPQLWEVAWDVPRSFGWSMGEAWTTCDAPSATCRSHGGFEYVDSSFELVPAIELWREAGWSADPANPAVWRRSDGSVAAEYERFASPRDYDRGESQRYPRLHRWIAHRSSAEQLSAILGFQLLSRTRLERFKS